MTRKEHLKYCKFCIERKFDKKRGIICGLTNEIAAFEIECKDFKKDETVIERPADDEDFLMAKDIKSEVSEEQYQKLIADQNLPAAVVSGIMSAFLGAIIWAVITILTGFQFGFMAIGVGAIVGFSIRYFGNGIEPKFGIIGASLAIFGCITGNLISIIGVISNEASISFWETFLNVSFGDLFGILFGEWLQFVDFIFYGIAAFEGFKFSMRKITEKSVRDMRQF